MASGGMDNSVIMDEVIKRRLLIDGDGLGDDRRLVGLTKSFINWCNATEESKEESEASFKRLTCQLKQVEYAAKRTHFAIVANEKVKAMYIDLGQEVQEEIEETRAEITESKDLLEAATKHRNQSLEFDALAKLIESKPDRGETEKRVGDLKKELSKLEKCKQSLNSRLENRKKHMFAIAAAVDQVEEALKEQDDFEEMLNNIEMELNDDSILLSTRERLIETEETGTCCESEQTSPMQQSPDESSPEQSSVSGTVIQVSLSPLEKKASDKYDELSENSENEDRT